jgi:hypothetical protein
MEGLIWSCFAIFDLILNRSELICHQIDIFKQKKNWLSKIIWCLFFFIILFYWIIKDFKTLIIKLFSGYINFSLWNSFSIILRFYPFYCNKVFQIKKIIFISIDYFSLKVKMKNNLLPSNDLTIISQFIFWKIYLTTINGNYHKIT